MVLRFNRQPVHHIPISSLEVRMTESKGWGLFTKEKIDQEFGIEVIGEVIPQWKEEVRSKEYLRRNECWIHAQCRLYDRMRVYCIDQKNYSNLTRFLNHSCKPNMTLWQQDNGRSLVAYPNRQIQPGEELTIQYNMIHAAGPTLVCHCGEKECLGQIL